MSRWLQIRRLAKKPLDLEDYQELKPYGLNTVLVYQETYHQDDYDYAKYLPAVS